MLSMNIFFIDQNPWTAAQCLHDRHILSGINEAAQVLSSVWWKVWTNRTIGTPERHKLAFGVDPGLRYLKHPLVDWAARSEANWKWAMQHLQALIVEKSIRWPDRPQHIFATKDWLLSYSGMQKQLSLQVPNSVWGSEFTPPPQLVAESCKQPEEDWIKAYRLYYRAFKLHYVKPNQGAKKLLLATNVWTNRKMPAWIT